MSTIPTKPQWVDKPKDVCLWCKFFLYGSRTCLLDGKSKDPEAKACNSWRYCA